MADKRPATIAPVLVLLLTTKGERETISMNIGPFLATTSGCCQCCGQPYGNGYAHGPGLCVPVGVGKATFTPFYPTLEDIRRIVREELERAAAGKNEGRQRE